MGSTETSVELPDWVDLVDFEGKSDCEYFLDLNIVLIETLLIDQAPQNNLIKDMVHPEGPSPPTMLYNTTETVKHMNDYSYMLYIIMLIVHTHRE